MPVGLPKQGKTTASYWLQECANPLARQGADSPFVDENVDIVVIGSGITGVSAVHHLVQGMKREKLDKLKITLLEARDFCT
jgi:NADH dehydrogenase FAD-containing subunit